MLPGNVVTRASRRKDLELEVGVLARSPGPGCGQGSKLMMTGLLTAVMMALPPRLSMTAKA